MPRLNLRPEALARLAPLTSMALVVALAHGAAELTWRVVPVPSVQATPAVAVERPSATTTAPEPAVTDYDAIAGWHLFGEVGSAPPPPPAPIAAPETRLNLRLVGLFYGESARSALALIAEGNGEELAYRVGARLPGGATLEQILADRVVLSRNGRMETLSLPQDQADLGLSTEPADAGEYGTPAPGPVTDPVGGTVVDASAIAGQMREAAALDPRSLQDLAFVDPYVQNGQFMGFRLRPGRDRRLLRRLGLRSGDVLTEVNGVRLDDPARGLTLLESLYSADEVSVQVLRNGAEISYTFRLSTR